MTRFSKKLALLFTTSSIFLIGLWFAAAVFAAQEKRAPADEPPPPAPARQQPPQAQPKWNMPAPNEWRVVTPAELEMKTPQVEPDADAEAIFWEVSLDDQKKKKVSFNHYVRVKIFTERGREKFSKFDIPFYKGRTVEEVAARVIKPDGTIINLKPEDIFEREIVKTGRIRLQAKSFAVPGIEPGVIVEYRYKEVIKNGSINGASLLFQRDVPMQRVTYYVRPYEKNYVKFDFHNMPEIRFVQNGEGFYVGTATNVPALKEEPYMPPDDEVRRWASISYTDGGGNSGGNSWSLFGDRLVETVNRYIEPGKLVQQKAAELTAAGGATDLEKLRRIYDFAQKNIRNVSYDSSISESQIEALKIKDAEDVLRRGVAPAGFVDLLFASLARASGFNVSVALAGDRSENFFDPMNGFNPSYIRPAGVAIRAANNTYWYFSPGTPYLPFGRMNWNAEDVYVMLLGSQGQIWKKTPLSDAQQSPARRSGKFKLDTEGTLEGLVRIEYDGHQAAVRRAAEIKDSPEKREQNIKEEIKKRISAAEITDITIENFSDAQKPLVYIFKIRVPNYAQRTGKRLFFQPGFFEYGTSPVFSSVTRTHRVYFQYPWSEEDDIEFELPKEFLLDSVDAPVAVADSQKIGNLKINLSVDKVNNQIVYRRSFYFGRGGQLLYPVVNYQGLKSLFDGFYKSDAHTITLKQK